MIRPASRAAADAVGDATTPPPSAVELERRAYRKRQSSRSVLIGLVSTLVLAVALGAAVLGSPGWARVQQSFFDPQVALDSLPRILEGLLLNIQVLVVASLGVAVKYLPVGTAYAVWVGVGAVGTAVLGIVLLGEAATLGRVASISLIVAGIVGLKLATP